MADPRVKKLAHLLVNYCVKVGPGDKVAIRSSPIAQPLVVETYREVVRAGGYPYVIWQEDIFTEIMLKEGNENQLQHIPDPTRLLFKTYDCFISIAASENTRTLSGVNPHKQQTAQFASRDLMQTVMQRSADGLYRWVTTLFPTNAHAQEADMSLDDFTDFVFRACFVNQVDPVAEWQKLSQLQQKLIDWLAGKKEIRVHGPHIDLTLSIAGRTFINADGSNNMPSGEIFTGPVEQSVNGSVRFTYPAIYGGREVNGVELVFRDGKVIDFKARKNGAFLGTVLDTDPGARYLGEFAIGTNNGIQRFTKSILFDEKIGGTIHMALGNGYPETGSVNKSAVHWDMICDMRDGGKIWVDDELFYDSGRFVILD